MKSKIVLFFVSLFLLFFSSGCASGGGFVGLMYNRSGVFVTNNYADHTIAITTNNGMSARIETGQTFQVVTAGLINRDTLLVTAKFYDKVGNYVGYDSREFRVYYRNGSPYVEHWDPRIREKRVVKEKIVRKKK